jgi:antitoxin HigA-1
MTRITTHPGEILKNEFMLPLNMSARELASKLKIPANRISEIIRGRRDVTASTALRLGHFFGTTPELWLNLQSSFDLSKAKNELGSLDDLPVMDAA